ncbi:hypothetical protein N7540_006501 [Penicillium herquei]|nr:hypothetical protein N7540_006501 [Penicillium herquei]
MFKIAKSPPEPSHHDGEYFDLASRRGLNWHAFTAGLLQSGIAPWFIYVVRIFRLAFENEPHKQKEIAEYRIRAAAHKKWKKWKKGKKSKKGKKGKKDKRGISRERWEFWEASFREFGDEKSGEMSEETASACRKAALQRKETSLPTISEVVNSSEAPDSLNVKTLQGSDHK